MTRRLFLALAAALSMTPYAFGDPSSPSTWDEKSLVAHEWGTFTSLQGSDGVVLDGLRHEETDLPGFVHDLRDFTGITGVSPKMETPVIYFYSPKEVRVRVRVDFPRGVITQWYPAAHSVNHQGRTTNGVASSPSGRVITNLEKGYISWGDRRDLKVLAPSAKAALPEVEGDDPWRFCRQVDANTVSACNLNAARRTRSGEMVYENEKCLFYRGLGDFSLPLVGKVQSDRTTGNTYAVRLTLQNALPREALTHLFVVQVENGRAGFAYVPRLDDQRELKLEMKLQPLKTSTETLVKALAARLTETGLYEKEALAMARTWQAGYFQDEGLRVLYVLPRAFIDRELPLKIEHHWKGPAFEVVRTFVGRTELLTPRREARLNDLVRELAKGDAQARSQARERITALGRFSTPYLVRAKALTRDPAIQSVIEAELQKLELRR